ncbi:MAG: hypothetical protein HYX28_04270 [Candidatus Koribacter versatilis]|uniref:Uncharacterized protein n=1 Tax=Candidatus Korobacter versatilis TaxID=658062 RepID=A0A932A780_9BACT|nr:hypothetical protein [Candidatus Koribacter versatilis]
MAFEQAKLAVGNEVAFAEFKSVLESTFSPANVEQYLKSVSKKGLRVRHFEQARDAGLFDRYRNGKSVSELWNELTGADQGQVREMYLTKLEEVAPELRQKFSNIYQYA